MNSEDLFMLKENLEILADERDPQTGYRVEDTILRSSFNKRVLRDAASIIDLLLKIDFNPQKTDKRKKYAFYIPQSERCNISISETPIPISVFAYALNDCVDAQKMKKIKASQITAWLMKEGYLSEIDNDGEMFKVLADKSSSIGISAEERTSKHGHTYKVNLYDKNAQQFIIDHLDDIVIQDKF